MPKKVAELLETATPVPPQEPHATIAAFLGEDGTTAYNIRDIVTAVRKRRQSFQLLDIEKALQSLVAASVIAEASDGATYWYFQRGGTPSVRTSRD